MFFDRFESYEVNREAYLHLVADSLEKIDYLEGEEYCSWLSFSKQRYCSDVWNEYRFIRRNNFEFEVLENWEDLVFERESECIGLHDHDFIDRTNIRVEVDVNFASMVSLMKKVGWLHRSMKMMLSTCPLTYHHPAAGGSWNSYRRLQSFEGYRWECTPFVVSFFDQSSLRTSNEISSFARELNYFQIDGDMMDPNIKNGQMRHCISAVESHHNSKIYRIDGSSGYRNLKRKNRLKEHIVTTNLDVSEFELTSLEDLEYSREFSIEFSIADAILDLEDINMIHIIMLRKRHSLNFSLERVRGSREKLREVVCTVVSALSKHTLPS